VYIVPLVYRVWPRGYPASAPDADADGDAEPPLPGLLDGELVQAAAVARVRAAAAAAVPQRATRLLTGCGPAVFTLLLTCPYLLTMES
jgi:hypothetical protein